MLGILSRPLNASIALLLCPIPCAAEKTPCWQPVIDYTISFPGDRPDAAPTINPFENFTHLGSDFGWMGPGGARIDSKGGIIRVHPHGEWTGAWHSLAGLGLEKTRLLDPTDLLQLGGPDEKTCSIIQIAVHASGRGMFRLELADANRKVVWKAADTLDSDRINTHLYPIDARALGKIKILHWIAEPGCNLQLSSIGFMTTRPAMPLDEWAFRISLGKLRRCHDAESGFTRDRAHLPAGHFDSIASTGMHALASALAATEEMLDRSVAASEIRRTIEAMQSLKTASGFLPHFTQFNENGKAVIVPGTEYSTIDTAIALHSLLLATRILELDELNRQVSNMIFKLDFDAVTCDENWISHGYLDDAKTPLRSSWRDWGGETALVLMLENMIPQRAARGKMTPSGEPYRGVGFIAEIQSLFYPDFDRPDRDLVSGISWPAIRKKILTEQTAYFTQHIPQSAAAKAGIFGLSAGESGMPGGGYSANGTEVMGVRWIHPHYMLMGLGLSGQTRYLAGLEALHARQFLYPYGLPENIEADLVLHNPMQGSLNAAFETLSAYHGWKKRGAPGNRIDHASLADPLLRKAVSRFYPPQN
ncbi:MAG: hypothetical protein RL346_97 [Verrucomicrobiota bacterium]|jgi:hypothetical protein